MALILLFIIPSAFGADNETVSLQADSDIQPVADDIYFDCNASDDQGDGSPEHPYRGLRDGRILDNSVIHLKNGKYDVNQFNSHTNISIIGEDASKTIVNGNGGILIVYSRFCLTNVTICNLNILNQGDLYASNAIFANSSSTSNSQRGENFGGAIYCLNSYNNAYLTNCTFINNYAGCGGAIYLNGGILEATNCVFIDNTALNYGGAIAVSSKNSRNIRVTIKRSSFINDVSLKDAGGAIYIKSGKFTGEDLNISQCKGTFGGALTILSAHANLTNLRAFNNSATYDGGALYQMYGNLTLNNSLFLENHAKNGGGLFVDNTIKLIVNNVSFENNSAKLLAGAFYSLANEVHDFTNLTYMNNTAAECNDLFEQTNMSAIFLSGNYTLYNNGADDSTLPSYYSSVQEGYVTPVKNQQSGGNCWAFATLAALESAILKASGDALDLSEENMKNLASIYSYYGWSMNTNEGGYDDMGFGYLTSWLGPILEIDDAYNDFTLLSPVLDSILHVQNMVFIKRSSSDDLDSIKRAIMNYGAAYSPIFMTPNYDSSIGKYVQCYRGFLPCDHAVALVGWDDDFYMPGAPGRGAWIAKNSWGASWGNGGYFYVSYFDKSCPKIGEDDGAIAFIFNDTIKYDKNYQYDIAKTDYFLNTTSIVWYKNIFEATDNEYLAAVSTYFEKNTHWDLTINVNNVSKVTRSGYSLPGYYTFDLDEFIPLNVGDIFEIIFKITVDGDAGVPISEIVSLNHIFYRENSSYISYDGMNWKDLFNLTWKYPDHIYDSQVACIKAFTVLNPINTTLTLTIENRTDSSADLIAQVLNQWGYPAIGNVTFRIGNETYIVKLVNGIAKKHIALINASLSAEYSAVGYNSSIVSLELHNPLVDTNITLIVEGQYNPLNITARILDGDNNPVKYGYVTFSIENNQYKVKVSNGTAKLENIYILARELNISAVFNDSFYYQSCNTTIPVEILRINTKIKLNVTSANDANNPVRINLTVVDPDDNPVTSGFVHLDFDGDLQVVELINGSACIDYTFPNTGNKSVNVTYYDDYLYDSSAANESLVVSKIKANMTLKYVVYETTAVLGVEFKNATREFKVIFYVNDMNYTAQSKRGVAICEIYGLDFGTYEYTVQLISDIYEADEGNGTFNITIHKTQIIASNAVLYYNGDYVVVLKDKSGNVIADRDIYITLNGQKYKKRTNSEGIAVFNFALRSGQYEARIDFVGDDEYYQSSLIRTLNFKSSIDFVSYVYSANFKYLATLYGSDGGVLANSKVNVVLDGVNYEAHTDANGRLSLNINNNQSSDW